MLTGGFKIRAGAVDAHATGETELVGLARTMILDPDLAAKWVDPVEGDPPFPTFESRDAKRRQIWEQAFDTRHR